MSDLARILVHEGVLSPEGLAQAKRAAREGDIVSSAYELELADEGALARALSLAYECPAVDLSRSAIPVACLAAMDPDFCRERRLLPASVGANEVVLAMADPDDLQAADEVRFLTGKKALRYVAVATALERALQGLERAQREGVAAWQGERGPPLGEGGEAVLAVVKAAGSAPQVPLPEAREALEVVELAELVVPFQPSPPPAPPATASRPAPPAPRGPSTLRLEGMAVGKVVLIADDDASVRQLLSAVLGKMGCVVLQAADGTAALELVRDARPDLALLDAMMPGMHGFEVCRAIKGDAELRATRVVLCSAVYRGSAGADARTAFGADAFVEKPFRLDELTRVVKLALLGPAAAETAEERGQREQAQGLWRAAAEALAAGRLEEAAELARDAASRDPWSAEAHYYLGHALSKQGLLLEAVAAYERAGELRPDVDATHQCLAQTYERLGFQKSAREAWGRAIETCKDPARKKAMQAQLMRLLA